MTFINITPDGHAVLWARTAPRTAETNGDAGAPWTRRGAPSAARPTPQSSGRDEALRETTVAKRQEAPKETRDARYAGGKKPGARSRVVPVAPVASWQSRIPAVRKSQSRRNKKHQRRKQASMQVNGRARLFTDRRRRRRRRRRLHIRHRRPHGHSLRRLRILHHLTNDTLSKITESCWYLKSDSALTSAATAAATPCQKKKSQ